MKVQSITEQVNEAKDDKEAVDPKCDSLKHKDDERLESDGWSKSRRSVQRSTREFDYDSEVEIETSKPEAHKALHKGL